MNGGDWDDEWRMNWEDCAVQGHFHNIHVMKKKEDVMGHSKDPG